MMPAPTKQILARREGGRAHFLVTGATGFLGAHVVGALLGREHPVTVLVRERADTPAAERIRHVLGWLGLEHRAHQLSIVVGDVAKQQFGLPDGKWETLAESVDEVVHCAASTRFSEASRPELERVNIGGTRNTLALAARNAQVFHLVSTAFVVGCAEGVVDEAWREPSAFTNAYEQTKYHAEVAARHSAATRGFSLCVYRPTIVVGHSETGRSLLFNALYYPIKTLLLLRDLYLHDLRRDGAQARALGIQELSDGHILLPVRVETRPGASLNLVPVDHFTRAFLALLDAHPGGGTFHIATDEAIGVETLVEFTQRLYGIQGIETVSAQSFAERPRSALEVLFENYTAVYRPYMRDLRRFASPAAAPTLDAAGLRCPRFTFEVFQRLMHYAQSVDWGKRLFGSGPDQC